VLLILISPAHLLFAVLRVRVWRVLAFLDGLAAQLAAFFRGQKLTALIVHGDSINLVDCVLAVALIGKVLFKAFGKVLLFRWVGVIGLSFFVEGIQQLLVVVSFGHEITAAA